MLKDLKKTSKLILSISWWIHLFACSAGQVKMSMGRQVGSTKTSVQNHQAEGAMNRKLDGGEFNHIDMNHATIQEIRACIYKGLQNVKKCVDANNDFKKILHKNNINAIELKKILSRVKKYFKVPNEEQIFRLGKEFVSTIDPNNPVTDIRQIVTRLDDFLHKPGYNSPIKKVVDFIFASYITMTNEEKAMRDVFESWKASYADIVKGLTVNNQLKLKYPCSGTKPSTTATTKQSKKKYKKKPQTSSTPYRIKNCTEYINENGSFKKEKVW